ncbi:MAG: fibrobacter succinogenes major paralogous domain-containing protein [Fibrobacter sp.]|nr:fibrobacter succinogenes major paralogous domain-containing protein [Fibrobacter sp.]
MNKFTFTASVCVAFFFAACGDDGGSATRPSEESSSSVALSSSSSSVIPSSSSSKVTESAEVTKGSITDTRDGHSYKTVTIGSQTWMAQNLNYETVNSYCYSDNASNCTKYGRLYTWAAAMDSVGSWSANGKGCGYGKTCSPTYPVRGVCPEGWHLPTQTEWNTLFTAVGGQSTAGKMLKSTSGWNSSGNGTDAYSFSALPAGGRGGNGHFNYEGNNAYFWSSTDDNSYYAYSMILYYNGDYAGLDDGNEGYGFSVRCVKD